MTSTILLRQPHPGMEEEWREEKHPIYGTREYKVIKYKGYEFEVRQDEEYTNLDEEYDTQNDVFLVNYHRDFYVTRDDIITEDETKQLYQGEINWQKTERKKGYWIFELSCLIHGDVWLHFGGDGFVEDPGGWDTSRVGLVLVSKKIARTQKKAEEIGEEYIDTYNKLLSGEVYYIVIKKDNKIIDSIYGIIGKERIYDQIKKYAD
ncbi:MAG: hypothetical protein QXD43_04865 [Candidatus Aenigmatarchaeota archaeon]